MKTKPHWAVPAPCAPTPQFDWAAYQYLQEKYLKAKDPFTLEALDLAMERLFERPVRSVTGIQLAENLFRDGKRVASRFFCHSGKQEVGTTTYHSLFTPLYISPSEARAERLAYANNLIKQALSSLTHRECAALFLRATKHDSDEIINDVLAVGKRQYRNIIQDVKQKLLSWPNLKESCCLLSEHAVYLPEANNLLQYLETLLPISK